MWALIVTVTINLQALLLFNLEDGQPVYMRTTVFKVAVGQFPDKATCEAYTGYQNFTLKFTDGAGNSYTYTITPTTINGCYKVL